jgi:hypothetical protein
MKRLTALYSATLLTLAVLCVCPALEARQSADSGTALVVNGDVDRPRKLSLTDLAKLPRRSIEINENDGRKVVFDGVSLGDLLGVAGFKLGEELRGARLASYLLVTASDGYRAVFALPELDPAFAERQIILAYRLDGKGMTAPEGPLRIIVPDEKRRARWVRQVTTLSILKAPADSVKQKQ